MVTELTSLLTIVLEEFYKVAMQGTKFCRAYEAGGDVS
jgi:hypothetical protein